VIADSRGCVRWFLGKPGDPIQLKHHFAPDGESFTVDHIILRVAKRLEIKARRERTSSQRLERATLPAIALVTPMPQGKSKCR
jgi:hypothetical protein